MLPKRTETLPGQLLAPAPSVAKNIFCLMSLQLESVRQFFGFIA
jgi:hypothetical protein